VARQVKARLVGLGARVLMSRSVNRQDRWGPCVDVRGRQGNSVDADLKISIHGDGSSTAGAHGFHVIAPADRKPWTHDIFGPSRRLALDVRAALSARGVPVANYFAGGDGLDLRSHLGNMRSRADARWMTSKAGRATYARALVAPSRAFLDR
jgi:N-acetylmuramoyl-L-alanine amidase